ncbi:hypothetical protein D6C86_07052 [Aureobasidium pullulans]|nr:hypothetical protein D6C86_07052 [Aureobasidium pullulans]THZ68972.1 hypothetical protein D6C88_07913 [Aureobasidium pullulans]
MNVIAMRFTASSLSIAAWATLAAAIPGKSYCSSPGNASIDSIHQVPKVPNLENLFIRSNGDVLVTSSSSPSLYLLDADHGSAHLLANIPEATGLTGIAELERDVFYVAAANVTGTRPIAIGTNAVWRVDLRKYRAPNGVRTLRTPKVELVARVPSAGLLNGMTRFSPRDDSNLFISDSALGNVIRLNVKTALYETVIENESTAGAVGSFVAVNGLRTFRNHLFFTNQARRSFSRIPFAPSTGLPTGPAELIINGTLGFADDFALSRNAERAWILLNSQNVLLQVDIASKTSNVVLNSTSLEEGSSAAVVPDVEGCPSLYVTGSTPTGGVSVGALFEINLL